MITIQRTGLMHSGGTPPPDLTCAKLAFSPGRSRFRENLARGCGLPLARVAAAPRCLEAWLLGCFEVTGLGAWMRAVRDAERTWDCEPGSLAWRGDAMGSR